MASELVPVEDERESTAEVPPRSAPTGGDRRRPGLLTKPGMRAFFRSFVYAYFGIVQVLASQTNMKVHCVIAIPILIATQLLGFSPIENVIVLFCIVLVLACEIVNTSIEQLGDYVSPEYHPAIGRAKDAAAAMVLISAIGAAAIGIILFSSEGRLLQLVYLDFHWRWGGTVDNVMIKLFFLGICWLFFHASIYRRNHLGVNVDSEVGAISTSRHRWTNPAPRRPAAEPDEE